MIEKLLPFLLLATQPQDLPAAQPDEPEVTVRANAARPAIERILQADNLDVDNLPPHEVAETMAAIPRGQAPLNFWVAYQAHVQAWQDYADAKNRSRGASATDIDRVPNGAAITKARRRINHSFDLVKAIARRYGARMPASNTRFRD
jgi:hypothetical protein